MVVCPIRSMVLARVAEWQTRRTQNPLFVRTCGFKSHLGHQVIPTLTPMGQRLLQRRLTQTSSRIRELREELRVVEDQMDHLVDEADELSLRALVSETPAAEYEYRQAKKHADVIRRRHSELVKEIQELEHRINDLLDRMKGTAS